MPASFLLLALTLAGNDADTALRLPRNGAVEIDTHVRDVSLRVGTTDFVTVNGAAAELDGGTLSIGDDMRRGRAGGPIEVIVPAWCRVDISSVGGNISLTGTPNRLHAETVNGFIHVTGGSGVLELETVAGEIVVADFHGTKLSVDATDGGVAISNASGTLAIDNVNGGITLKGIRSTSVAASTVNGPVDFEGTFAAIGNYEFSSQNDNVTLTLPGDVSARMEITTMNGVLRSAQIPATTNGTRNATSSKDKGRDKDRGDGERTFTAVFGSGAARVTVEAFNGDVIVKQRKP